MGDHAGDASPVVQAVGLTGGQRPPAFRRVDLVVGLGQGVVVVGPSGGGKTLLLRALLGLDAVAEGAILWFGEPCHDEGAFRLARRRMGVVFDDGGLLGSSTVAVNVAWGLGQRGRGADRPEVLELLDLLELRPDLLPEELSPWQRKRVGLARALVARPDVLLVDGMFDPDTTARLDGIVSRTYWPNRPLPTRVQFSTQVPASTMTAERLVLVGSDGVLVSGPRDEVLASPDPDVQLLLGRFAWNDT